VTAAADDLFAAEAAPEDNKFSGFSAQESISPIPRTQRPQEWFIDFFLLFIHNIAFKLSNNSRLLGRAVQNA
jgi:hypothetical protein